MNITDWKDLPPDQLAVKLRSMGMTWDRYKELLEQIAADQRMEAELRAAGTLPDRLPDGKLGDNESWGAQGPTSLGPRRG